MCYCGWADFPQRNKAPTVGHLLLNNIGALKAFKGNERVFNEKKVSF